MLPVVERPMIYHIIEWLAGHGVSRVVFALGYHSEVFFGAFPDGRHAGIEVVWAVEPDPRDTAGAIVFAADHAEVAHDRLIVVNGDILTNLDLRRLLSFHDHHGRAATIALTPVADPSAFGVVPVDQTGRVLAFIEKPKPGEAPTNMINAGTYVLEPSVLRRIARGVRVSIEREVFPELVVSGELYAMDSDCYWLDTGTPERFLQAQRDLLLGLGASAIATIHTELDGKVFVAQGADVKGKLIGPSFVAERCSIDASAQVASSVVGADVIVGPGVRLRDCVVMQGARIGPDVSAERCIIGPRAQIGMGAELIGSIIGVGYELEPAMRLVDARLPE